MIYSNIRVNSRAKAFDFGVIHQITLGKRGRKLVALTCPPFASLMLGINRGFSIGRTKSGRTRIVEGEDDSLYMVLLGDVSVSSSAYELLAGGADCAGCVLRVPNQGIVKTSDYLVIRNQAVYRYGSIEECQRAGVDVPSFVPIGDCVSFDENSAHSSSMK